MDDTIFIDMKLNSKKKLESLDYDSFIIIKPGFLNHANEILEDLRQHGYEIVRAKEMTMTIVEAKRLYQVHRKKKFFTELADYMASAPSLGIILKSNHANRDVAIDDILMLKEKYRKKYAIDVMRNVLHASDTYQNMLEEVKVYFDDKNTI